MKLIKDFQFKSQLFFGRCDLQNCLRVVMSDGSSAMVLYRCAQSLRKIKLGFLGWFFLEANKWMNGCVIGRCAEFDDGFVIMHPFGIVINGGVQGGKNIVLESGVVIGAARNGLPVEVPVLGHNIFIGSGAKILGKIRIGNRVKIGANAVVIKDVPDGATVVGIPGKIIKIENKSNNL